jgi:phage gp16-like protein
MTAALIRLVHVGARELGLDDDTRRDLQLVTTGKASLKDMTHGELTRVVEALKARGFTVSAKGKARRPPAARADVRFAHVLWRLLHDAGHAKVGGPKGLNAFIQARFSKKWGAAPLDIDVMQEWSQIRDVIDALTDWCRRTGIDVLK